MMYYNSVLYIFPSPFLSNTAKTYFNFYWETNFSLVAAATKNSVKSILPDSFVSTYLMISLTISVALASP